MFLPVAFSGNVLAAQLTIEKDVKSRDITVGDSIEIMLRFSNPFGKPIGIQIHDKNVIAGNGLDIQCLEYTLPADASSTVIYTQPITAFQSGDFTLGKATVTYTNPETGKEEQVQSNNLKLSVKQSQTQQNLQQHGITTVYQCGGMSMTSTSYSSSGSSTSIQISSGFRQNPGQRQTQRPDSIQQQNQDINTIKQQMQKQMHEEEQNRKHLENIINQSKEFSNAQKQLMKNGYQPDSKSINPDSNSSGSFEYTYKNEKGDTAKISGEIADNKIRELRKWSREDAEKLAELLENNTKFRQLHQQLTGQGYNISSKLFKEPEQNISDFNYVYEKPESGNKSISGNITLTGNIISIGIYGEDDARIWWIAPVIIILALLAYVACRKYLQKKKPVPEKPKPEKKIDFRKEALKLIDEAEKMFSHGLMKEAYAKVSEGVRFYFKHILNSGDEELTSTDILKKIKGQSIYKEAKKCFELCDLVKFAKYRPNKKDFTEAATKGKMLIEHSI